MFDTNLQNFLDRHGACANGLSRLQRLGVETLEQAWDKASDDDLIWAVTRPGVMSSEQRRQFLVMVLSSIEDKLTDMRSLNILTKLRTKETITSEDRKAAARAASAAESAAECAAAEAARAASAAVSAAWAAWAVLAARAAWAASAASAAASAAESAAWAVSAAQAKWVRENFRLCDLRIN